MALVIVLVLLVVGSVVFHFVSPWWFTPVASNWSSIDDTIAITFYITGFVFVAVNLFLAYTIYRFRYNPNRRARYEPENKKLEIWLTAITAVGVAVMLAPGLVVWADFVTVPEGADEIEVVGEQWQWSYRFPGEDGVLGKVDARYIGPDNLFGMSPNDEAGLDDILINSNELHLPIDRPVKVNLRSKDVLHDFAVSEFRVKMDLVPGLVSYLWFTPTRTGKFDILCMELCGIAHYAMRGYVVVDEQADFDDWLGQQKTWADIKGMAPGDAVAGKNQYTICASCHGQNGEGNETMNAPRLAGLQTWYVERQLKYYQQGIRGANAGDSFGQQMAPMAGMLADETAIRDVAAYIVGLKATPSKASANGDIKRGAHSYVTCGACHGAEAQGNYALSAPRLAGQSDWYLRRQLENFQLGIRGAHKSDSYGHQMVLMAKTLQDEQAVDDLLAYLNSI
ncbi:MAG: c-type cytochrome [Proteobacteria bacterium]|nr:c-type cytochrome [Pseudomonadota bacterium]